VASAAVFLQDRGNLVDEIQWNVAVRGRLQRQRSGSGKEAEERGFGDRPHQKVHREEKDS